MKQVTLSIILLLSALICNAQIAAPNQTDTLIITSVKYNYADIDRANWPCEIIYKSTKDIRIGEQKFNIINAYKLLGIITFTVYDTNDSNKKHYELNFTEDEKDKYTLSFSGYEFTYYKKRTPKTNTESADVATVKANKRALFPEPDEKVPEGHGKSLVSLSPGHGRSLIGSLPKPSFQGNAKGTVVVKVWVDNYGIVQKAVAGAEGTTINDTKLWKAAKNAAMKACFNISVDAPALEEGTITYIFK